MNFVKLIKDLPLRILVWYHLELMDAQARLEQMKERRRG